MVGGVGDEVLGSVVDRGVEPFAAHMRRMWWRVCLYLLRAFTCRYICLPATCSIDAAAWKNMPAAGERGMRRGSAFTDPRW